MTLEPLVTAGPVIFIHAVAALTAFLLGIIQFVGPKGSIPHRILGWSWVILMAIVAISSFWIHTIKQFGNFSWIHALSVITLISLFGAVKAARAHKVDQHRKAMITTFIGALLIAGIFTLLPGRIMYQIVFG